MNSLDWYTKVYIVVANGGIQTICRECKGSKFAISLYLTKERTEVVPLEGPHGFGEPQVMCATSYNK